MTDKEKNLKDLASDLHTSLCEGSDLSEHDCVTEEILDVLKVAFDLGKESKIGIVKFRVEQEVLKLEKENEELKASCSKLIKVNNELRDSLRKYEIVPDVDYLPNGVEVYKENVGNNPYGVK